MAVLPWYCTREEVKRSLDIKSTARNNASIDRNIGAASRSVEDLTNRWFYPDTGVRYFDWPNDQYARSWRIWLDRYELISLTALANRGGLTIPPAQYFLEPSDGPPYNRIELDISVQTGSVVFGGASTWQRAVVATGVFGYCDDRAAAGAVAVTASTTATTLDVTDSSVAEVGTLLVGAGERMFVTGRSHISTTATMSGTLAASMAAGTVAVSDGTLVQPGEVALIDAEKLMVNEVVGNNLLVTRAWDGTTLAAHSGSPLVYCPRRLTVSRAFLGTTAATQTQGVALQRQVYPDLVRQLTLAEAVTNLLQESSGYARMAGGGDNAREFTGKGIKDLRCQVEQSFGKLARIGVI